MATPLPFVSSPQQVETPPRAHDGVPSLAVMSQTHHTHGNDNDEGDGNDGRSLSNQQDARRAAGDIGNGSRVQERKAQVVAQRDQGQQTVANQRETEGEEAEEEGGERGGERSPAAQIAVLRRHHAMSNAEFSGRKQGAAHILPDGEQLEQQDRAMVTAAGAAMEKTPRRRTAPLFGPNDEVAIQNEIRTMIAQTEQLLLGSQRAQPEVQLQQQHPQSLASTLLPRPPPMEHPSHQRNSSASTRPSRLTLSDIMGNSIQDSEDNGSDLGHHVRSGLVLADADFEGDGDDEDDDESTEEGSLSTDIGAMFETDELSDGEMDLYASQVNPQRTYQLNRDLSHEGYGGLNVASIDVEDVGTDDDDATHSERFPSVSNCDVNVSKAQALKDSMQGNLVRLGFKENLTRLALDAGLQEIEHYDSDCELAYVDIFMSLVKMVCDAHLDSFSHRLPHVAWINPDDSWSGVTLANGSDRLPHISSLPFKWPVFDMAQFEFGNARPGTCFDSVCVLTNLPKVSMDRTEELMEILSCNLFCMIGDPIQVVIPSVSATGRTKGHAFLEFDDPAMAKACASAIDGLTWGRGPFGRIRSNMFRQYQVKSPTALQMRSEAIRNGESRRSQRTAMNESMGSSTTDANGTGARTEYAQFNEEDIETRNTNFFNRWRERFDDSFYTSSEGEGVDEGDDAESEDGGVWAPDAHPRGEFPSRQPFPQHPISIDDMDIEHLEHHNVMASHPSFGLRHFSSQELGQSRVNESQLSSDADGDDDDEKEYEDNESWESSSMSELLQADRERVSSDSHARLLNSRSSDLSDVRLPSPRIGALNHDPSVPNDFVSVGDEDEIVQTADESEKPWRSYCEELIARNREMQEQVAYARRRIMQLGHNNQKLHLLIDRVERDRDGLMFENDLLQTQLNGYEDHARHHAALTKELTVLRKCLKKKVSGLKGSSQDSPFSLHQEIEVKHSMMTNQHASSSSSASLDDVRFVFQQQLSSQALTLKSFDELKDWEQLLESSLASVRAMKEEKALELQKKLDRQVEEQQELKLCVICLSNEKSILCLPCRHLCLCESCSAHEEVEKCPICRLHIDEMLLVYA